MRLSFDRQFLIAGHALAAIGVAALATTHQVGVGYVVAALAALGWSLGREWRNRGWLLPAPIANLSMLVSLFVIGAPVVWQGISPIRPIAEFLLVLAALKYATAKESRDWVQISVLSFFHLLAASALTVEPVFALVFLAYLVVVPCVLVLSFLRREVGEAGGVRRLDEDTFVEPSLFRSLAVMTVVLFVSTVVVFVIFPRMSAGYFAAPFAGGAAHTGFSEQVGLGAVAALKEDHGIAMRVTVDHPELLAEHLYWRGAALDHFDGRNWTRRPQELQALARGGPGLFVSNVRPRRGPFVTEEVILEPQDSSMVFFVGRPIEVRGPFAEASTDGLGNLRVIRPTGMRTAYQITASLSPRRRPPTPETRALPSIDPRIVALARDQARDAVDDRGRAEALISYFRRGFRYTLSPGDPGTSDPLVRFLFDTKSGHCEYFASAYAVLLRVLGVPALVVNGYAGGEWNPFGNYFVIHQSNAHSWVEAFVDGEWRVFDPTPAGDPVDRGLSTRLSELVDAAQMRWYRYVVNYSLEDQAEAALSLRDVTRRFWQGLSGDWWKEGPEEGRNASTSGAWRPRWMWLVALLPLGLVLWLWRGERRARRRAEEALSEASRHYARLLRFLEGVGLGKQPSETGPEFCRRIGPSIAGEAEQLARVTSLYEEARFSGRERGAERLDREVDDVIAALSRRGGDPTRLSESR